MAFSQRYHEPPMELQVHARVRGSAQNSESAKDARVIVDTGSNKSVISQSFAKHELELLREISFPVQLPNPNSAEPQIAVVPYYRISLQVLNSVVEGFQFPDFTTQAEIERELLVPGLADIAADQISDDTSKPELLLLVGMDLLADICFGYERWPDGPIFWMAEHKGEA